MARPASGQLTDIPPAARDTVATLLAAPTVPVAAQPLAHHAGLRSLVVTIERENPVVSLGALSPADVNRKTTEILGAPTTSEINRSLMVATAGLPFLLQPAIAAAASPDGEDAKTGGTPHAGGGPTR